jgi:hypothetical protein
MGAAFPLQARWTSTDDVFVRDVRSREEGVQVARELQLRLVASPAIVEFGRLDDASPVLGVGLGSDRSVLTFQESLDPPYYISLDPDPRRGTTIFVYAQEPTEYAAQNSVPIDVALTGLEEFIETGHRPASVPWERL